MIKVENVFKKYPNNNFYSSNGVSFRIEKNTTCGLLGNNGAGKSTIMKMLSTVYKPDKGRILINNLDTMDKEIEIKKMLGIVFETPRLFEDLTGRENIEYIGDLFGINKEIIRISYMNTRKKCLKVYLTLIFLSLENIQSLLVTKT